MNRWTSITVPPLEATKKRETFRSKIRYFIRLIRWLYKHRDEKDCRQKWRRMERELRRVE